MDSDEQDDHERCAGRVRGAQNYHMDEKGWADIAYNWLVCKHGYVFVGRGWGVRSAAQGTDDGNDQFHAVCFLGNDTDNRSDVTKHGRYALLQLLARNIERVPTADEIRPHNYFHDTPCPGHELESFARNTLAALQYEA